MLKNPFTLLQFGLLLSTSYAMPESVQFLLSFTVIASLSSWKSLAASSNTLTILQGNSSYSLVQIGYVLESDSMQYICGTNYLGTNTQKSRSAVWIGFNESSQTVISQAENNGETMSFQSQFISNDTLYGYGAAKYNNQLTPFISKNDKRTLNHLSTWMIQGATGTLLNMQNAPMQNYIFFCTSGQIFEADMSTNSIESAYSMKIAGSTATSSMMIRLQDGHYLFSGASQSKGWLTKLAYQNKVWSEVWSRTLSASSSINIFAIVENNNRIYLTGTVGSDSFIGAVNASSGENLWNTRSIGGAGTDALRGIRKKTDGSGGLIAYGYTATGTVGNNPAYWALSFDANGNIKKNMNLNGTGSGFLNHVIPRESGSMTLFGYSNVYGGALSRPVSVTTDSNGDIDKTILRPYGFTYNDMSSQMTLDAISFTNSATSVSFVPITGASLVRLNSSISDPGIQILVDVTATSYPTSQPSDAPSAQPTRQPTSQPSGSPSAQPTRRPTGKPSRQPSVAPSVYPTNQPSGSPSAQPTRRPTGKPSMQPSVAPSTQPTRRPTRKPSAQPSVAPSVYPTNQPSGSPSAQPSRWPTGQPSGSPSAQPTRRPTGKPSMQPSVAPSAQPTRRPTGKPSMQPSVAPSAQPTRRPTGKPSMQPSVAPSAQPTRRPTGKPSMQPSVAPSAQPTRRPTRKPSAQPSVAPSVYPTNQPSDSPSAQPTRWPTRKPSAQPTRRPTGQPSGSPSAQPSRRPTGKPSAQPSVAPSAQPSRRPTRKPSAQPSVTPSVYPTNQPSGSPSAQPTRQPTRKPSAQPSVKPSVYPTSQPSGSPSAQPSRRPTSQPSGLPSVQPSRRPTGKPSTQPSVAPSVYPTNQPSDSPSAQPTRRPTSQPSDSPSAQPSRRPTGKPSAQPSVTPSVYPTSQPSGSPSAQPSVLPSFRPTAQPSQSPSAQPSHSPSSHPTQPSRAPSNRPTQHPTGQPSQSPSTQPASYPTKSPSCSPSIQPSSSPSLRSSSSTETQRYKLSIGLISAVASSMFVLLIGLYLFLRNRSHSWLKEKLQFLNQQKLINPRHHRRVATTESIHRVTPEKSNTPNTNHTPETVNDEKKESDIHQTTPIQSINITQEHVPSSDNDSDYLLSSMSDSQSSKNTSYYFVSSMSSHDLLDLEAGDQYNTNNKSPDIKDKKRKSTVDKKQKTGFFHKNEFPSSDEGKKDSTLGSLSIEMA